MILKLKNLIEQFLVESSSVNITTTTEKLAQAINPEGLDAFNKGFYAGTQIPIRKLTGNEIVKIIGTTASAKILSDESWIADRFGNSLGAREIKRLLSIIQK